MHELIPVQPGLTSQTESHFVQFKKKTTNYTVTVTQIHPVSKMFLILPCHHYFVLKTNMYHTNEPRGQSVLPKDKELLGKKEYSTAQEMT